MFRLCYFPWIAQHQPVEAIRSSIWLFAKQIEVELERISGTRKPVSVLPPMAVEEQINAISEGRAHIALMNPLGFALARRRNPCVAAAAIAERIISGKAAITYRADLYVRHDSGITALTNIKGTSIGYGDARSTSNFLIPALMLLEEGVHPFLGFKRIEFLGGHDDIARAVYHGRVTVGAGHCGVISDLANQEGYEDAVSALGALRRSADIPSDPVAVNAAAVQDMASLEQAIIAAGDTDRGRAALQIFWGGVTALRPGNSSDYDYLIRALPLLGIDNP